MSDTVRPAGAASQRRRLRLFHCTWTERAQDRAFECGSYIRAHSAKEARERVLGDVGDPHLEVRVKRADRGGGQ